MVFVLITGISSWQQIVASDEQFLFWSIESDNGHAGFLLGTIHSEDPRVLEFTEEFLAALNGSAYFAMELVPNLPTLARLAESMHLPEGIELASIIGEERFAAVSQALSGYGVPA